MDSIRGKDNGDLSRRQVHEFSPGNVVEPLDLTDIAERWGWTYRQAVRRVYAAANAGDLRVIQRPGRQKYYLSDELEALFGPPSNPSAPLADKRIYRQQVAA